MTRTRSGGSMQIVLHVMAKSKVRKSLREIVIMDLQGFEYDLDVTYEKRIGRPAGWAKIVGKNLNGASNISLDAHS